MMLRLYYRLKIGWRVRRLAARDAAIERAWAQQGRKHATLGDHADFVRRVQ